ncbi:hypothetical protein IPM19_02775 [bacterium]|nr:MAG: hypothetical protein IPM19_02775 [bacterium]
MKTWARKLKIALLSTIVVFQFFAFLAPLQANAQDSLPDPLRPAAQEPTELPVYNAGVDQSIKDYLCTPEGTGTDLFDCIDRLYRFGISAGAVLIVFFIVYAGYIYMTGSEASKTKAKQTLQAAFTGMAVMLGSFLLLNFINPELVNIKRIQPPIFNAADLPSCEEIGFSDKCIITTGGSSGQVFNPSTGSGGAGAGSCKIMNSGACSVENMKLCSAWNPEDASRVCNLESAGGANLTIASGSDKCADGTSFSYGLWQINLTYHQGQPYMPQACQKTLFNGKNFSCRLAVSKAELQACVSALGDVAAQTKVACGLYKGRGGNFKDWICSAYRCQIPGPYSAASRSKFCKTFPPR